MQPEEGTPSCIEASSTTSRQVDSKHSRGPINFKCVHKNFINDVPATSLTAVNADAHTRYMSEDMGSEHKDMRVEVEISDQDLNSKITVRNHYLISTTDPINDGQIDNAKSMDFEGSHDPSFESEVLNDQLSKFTLARAFILDQDSEWNTLATGAIHTEISADGELLIISLLDLNSIYKNKFDIASSIIKHLSSGKPEIKRYFSTSFSRTQEVIRQQATVITWVLDDGADGALSFENESACDSFWINLCNFLGISPSYTPQNLQSDEDIGDIASNDDDHSMYNDVDDSNINGYLKDALENYKEGYSSDRVSISSGILLSESTDHSSAENAFRIPRIITFETLENLDEILGDIVALTGSSGMFGNGVAATKKRMIAGEILGYSILSQIIHLFSEAESILEKFCTLQNYTNLNDTAVLAARRATLHIFGVVRSFFHLCHPVLIRELLGDDYIEAVAGIFEYQNLECASDLIKRHNYRDQLRQIQGGRRIFLTEDPNLKALILRTQRIQYMKDFVLNKHLDDESLSSLTFLLRCNYAEIIDLVEGFDFRGEPMSSCLVSQLVDYFKKIISAFESRNFSSLEGSKSSSSSSIEVKKSVSSLVDPCGHEISSKSGGSLIFNLNNENMNEKNSNCTGEVFDYDMQLRVISFIKEYFAIAKISASGRSPKLFNASILPLFLGFLSLIFSKASSGLKLVDIETKKIIERSQKIAADVLVVILQFEIGLVRTQLLKQRMEKPQLNLVICIIDLISEVSTPCATRSQLIAALRTILDCGNASTRNQQNLSTMINLHQDRGGVGNFEDPSISSIGTGLATSDDFLNYFYPDLALRLLNSLSSEYFDGVSPDLKAQLLDLYLGLCDLLCIFVTQHKYRIKYLMFRSLTVHFVVSFLDPPSQILVPCEDKVSNESVSFSRGPLNVDAIAEQFRRDRVSSVKGAVTINKHAGKRILDRGWAPTSLRMAAVRLVRTMLATGDDFYVRFFMKQSLIGPLVREACRVGKDQTEKPNAYASALIDTFLLIIGRRNSRPSQQTLPHQRLLLSHLNDLYGKDLETVKMYPLHEQLMEAIRDSQSPRESLGDSMASPTYSTAFTIDSPTGMSYHDGNCTAVSPPRDEDENYFSAVEESDMLDDSEITEESFHDTLEGNRSNSDDSTIGIDTKMMISDEFDKDLKQCEEETHFCRRTEMMAATSNGTLSDKLVSSNNEALDREGNSVGIMEFNTPNETLKSASFDHNIPIEEMVAQCQTGSTQDLVEKKDEIIEEKPVTLTSNFTSMVNSSLSHIMEIMVKRKKRL